MNFLALGGGGVWLRSDHDNAGSGFDLKDLHQAFLKNAGVGHIFD